MSVARALPVFSVVFMIAYAAAMHFNLAPFSYYPQVGQFALGVAKPTPELGPAMYWYGWITDALVVAILVAAVVDFAVPARLTARMAPVTSWSISLLVIAFFLWDLRSWFTH